MRKKSWLSLAAALASTMLPAAMAQRPTFSDPAAPPFIVRLQRTTFDYRECALVRGDGFFHFERETFNRVEVSEGELDSSKLSELRIALNNPKVAALTQSKIAQPLVQDNRDEFAVSILRSPLTQDLYFPDRESRRPFDEMIDPLLGWTTLLRKHPHTSLDDVSGRNNCMPPHKIELKTRPQVSAPTKDLTSPGLESGHVANPSVTASKSDFLMRWQFDQIANGQVESTCVVAYASGRYRMEKSVQQFPDKPKFRAFENSLSEAEALELRGLLDEPRLRASSYRSNSGRELFREGQIASLSVAREGRLQQLTFSSFFGLGAPRTDQEERLVEPLHKWLKIHVEARKVSPLKDATATHCTPQAEDKKP